MFEYAKLKGMDRITLVWQPHKYSRVLDNLDRFVECFGVEAKLVILPVWAAGEEPVPIDFGKLFSKYDPIFADRVQRSDEKLVLLKDKKAIAHIDDGIVIGFGAGDITYQLRGLK